MTNIKQLEEDIDRARIHLEELRKQEKAAKHEAEQKRLEPLRGLAIKAHDCLCGYNHTDGCSWGYETRNDDHNWDGDAHQRWLGKLESFIKGQRFQPMTPEHIDGILNIIIAAKEVHPEAVWLIQKLASSY